MLSTKDGNEGKGAGLLNSAPNLSKCQSPHLFRGQWKMRVTHNSVRFSSQDLELLLSCRFFSKEEKKVLPNWFLSVICCLNVLFSGGGHSCSFILICALLIFSIWVWSSVHWSQWKDSHWLQWGMEQALHELCSNNFCYHLKFLYWSFLWKGNDLFMLIADNSCDVCGIQIMDK